jgi:hypothetical protein
MKSQRMGPMILRPSLMPKTSAKANSSLRTPVSLVVKRGFKCREEVAATPNVFAQARGGFFSHARDVCNRGRV